MKGKTLRVSEQGYLRIKNFLNNHEILNLLEIFETGVKFKELHRRNIRGPIGVILSKVEDLIAQQDDYSVSFSKLWLVHSEYSNVDISKLPYLPHFDRLRFLKVMIYLSETTEKNGSFFACKSNVHNYELSRRSLPIYHKERFLNDASKAGEFEAVTGSAGDAIIFDTNCPHYAGSISKGNERKVARFDFTNFHWNSYWRLSYLDRLKLLFRSDK